MRLPDIKVVVEKTGIHGFSGARFSPRFSGQDLTRVSSLDWPTDRRGRLVMARKLGSKLARACSESEVGRSEQLSVAGDWQLKGRLVSVIIWWARNLGDS